MNCQVCGHSVSKELSACPNCRAPVAAATARRGGRNWLTWRWSVRRLAIALILVLLPTVPRVIDYLQLRLPLRTSTLVREAVARANTDPRIAAQLGQPIRARWSIVGYIRKNETGWSEGRLSIPIWGPQGDATLYARAGRGSGLWVFTTLEFRRTQAPTIDLLAAPPSNSAGLAPRGPVHLVQLGIPHKISLDAFRDYYRATLGLEVDVLPPISVDPASFDPQRRQFIAESLISSMRRSLPSLSENPSAIVIGVIDDDMYIAASSWTFAFSFRSEERFAVISTARMIPTFHGLWPRDALLASRVRKQLTKNIGILAYGLPLNDDPTSLLYRGVYDVADIDLMQERFEGSGGQAVINPTVVTHRASPLEPEIRRRDVERTDVDARYPCFLAGPVVEWDGAAPIKAEVTTCIPGMRADRQYDELEVDLRVGSVVTRKTDLFSPDSLPLVLTRCHHSWDRISRAFGIGGNHPYDILPVGSRSPYTYVDLVMPDGAAIRYDRISEGTGYADAVYQHTASATPFLRSTFRWNGNGWDLRFTDGGLFVFPENYSGTRSSRGARVAMQDAAGHRIQFQRDEDRNLKRLVSPSGSALAFEYDRAYRVSQIADEQGRIVRYEYDVGGRLAAVSGGETRINYRYAGTLLVNVATAAEKSLIGVRYDRGRVAQVDLGDGRSYRFNFSFADRSNGPATEAVVMGSDGTMTRLDLTTTRQQ